MRQIKRYGQIIETFPLDLGRARPYHCGIPAYT